MIQLLEDKNFKLAMMDMFKNVKEMFMSRWRNSAQKWVLSKWKVYLKVQYLKYRFADGLIADRRCQMKS